MRQASCGRGYRPTSTAAQVMVGRGRGRGGVGQRESIVPAGTGEHGAADCSARWGGRRCGAAVVPW